MEFVRLTVVAFFDVHGRTEVKHRRCPVSRFKAMPMDAAGEFDHLAGLDVVQTIQPRAITSPTTQNAANFPATSASCTKVLDLVLSGSQKSLSLDPI